MSFKRLNYTPEEKQHLATLVEKYLHIVENKKSSQIVNQEKCKAWEEISDLYNSTSEIPRDTLSLRKLWNNMKQEARRNSAKEKIETTSTEIACSSNNQHINKKSTDEILETDFIENPIKIEEDLDYAATVDELINSALPPDEEITVSEIVHPTVLGLQQQESETKHQMFYQRQENSRRRSCDEGIESISALEQAKIDVLNVKKLATEQLIRHKEELHQLKVEKKKRLNELRLQHQEALLKLELEAKLLEFTKSNK